MALFEELSSVRITDALRAGARQNMFKMDSDGKIRIKTTSELDSPWLITKPDPLRCCHVWNPIWFAFFQMIPVGCLNCWKIIYRPRNLRQLFMIWEKQKRSGHVAKSGAERRGYSGEKGGYLSCWYTPLDVGLKGGRELFKEVSWALPGLPLHLKRGCTEMEDHFGPSDKWDAHRTEFAAMEAFLENLFEIPEWRFDTPQALELDAKRRLIIHAFEHGDKTYLDFVEAQFRMEPVHYDSSIHREEDYANTFSRDIPEEIDSSRIVSLH